MKDWKGNKNSAHAAIAAHRGGGESMRQEDDFYATDPRALYELVYTPITNYYQMAQGIISACRGELGYYIWECAAGTGNLSNWLKEHGFNVVASDLKFRGAQGIIEGLDFLQTVPCDKFKGAAAHPMVILTNPPYSLATEFIEHALEILPEGGLYIALMNITYLAGQKRYQRVYSKGSLREIYVFSKRIECWKNGELPKDKCGSIANYAWYVFQKGYKGQPTLYWL